MTLKWPVLTGIEALVRIRRECPNPPAVLMCSSLATEGSHAALKALTLGAADVIAKDASAFGAGATAMRDEIVARIKAIAPRRSLLRSGAPSLTAHRKLAPAPRRPAPRIGPIPTPAPPFELSRKTLPAAIVIGSSTGGPPVLEFILSGLPATLPVPIVIAQHMPAAFTRSMSERFDASCAISVLHAQDGAPLCAGCVYIIPGGQHGRIRRIPGKSELRLKFLRNRKRRCIGYRSTSFSCRPPP